MDADFCVLLALGCYLECRFSSHQQGPQGRNFLFGESDAEDEPIRINERYQRILRKVWKEDDFQELVAQVGGSVGTHSIRKFPATWAGEHGTSQDHIEIRGRWKGGKNGRTVNRYINVEQLPTDGMVANTLCVGGPVKYKARAGGGLTHAWLMENVVPGIKGHFQDDPANKLAEVLALPVLWCAMQPGLENMLTAAIRARIRIAYELIRPEDFHQEWNPVVKAPLLVCRVENSLCIDEIAALTPDAAPDAASQDPVVQQQQVVHAQSIQGHSAQLQTCLNQVHLTRQQLSQNQQATNQALGELRAWMKIKFETQAQNINKLRQAAHFAPPAFEADNGAPAAPQGFVGGAGIPAGDSAVAVAVNNNRRLRPLAKLSKSPKSVHDLWAEYQHGIGGNIAAKEFSERERGRSKNTYSRRKLIWTIVEDLVLAGFDADVACDKVYQSYGHNKSISYIIDRIYKDKRQAGGKDAPGESWKHPNCRVGA